MAERSKAATFWAASDLFRWGKNGPPAVTFEKSSLLRQLLEAR